jgi:hypothetical protein
MQLYIIIVYHKALKPISLEHSSPIGAGNANSPALNVMLAHILWCVGFDLSLIPIRLPMHVRL